MQTGARLPPCRYRVSKQGAREKGRRSALPTRAAEPAKNTNISPSGREKTEESSASQ